MDNDINVLEFLDFDFVKQIYVLNNICFIELTDKKYKKDFNHEVKCFNSFLKRKSQENKIINKINYINDSIDL
jgi:hypothetical protein